MFVTKITNFPFSEVFSDSEKRHYIWKIAVTILKYTRIVQVSRIVVIRGAAMIAGSRPNFFAASGRIHPMHFAIDTTAIIVIPRARASIRFWSYMI